MKKQEYTYDDEGRIKTKNPFIYFTDKNAKEGYVPNREMTAFSLGLAGQNLTYNLVNSWLFYFCTNILHISSLNVGIITSVSRIWDGINDPLVGSLIDRRRAAPGQKLHPFLGKLPLIVGILTLLMFVDFGFSETVSMAFILCVYLAWDMFYSFQDVALWGTLSLISPFSKERSRVAQWLNIFISAACGLVGLIPLILGARQALGVSEKTLFFIFGLVFGFGGELLSMFAAKTKERVILNQDTENVSIKENFKILLSNRNMMCLILAQVLGSLSLTVPWIYFFKYCVSYQIGGFSMNGETAQFWYSAIASIPGAFAMFFAVKIANKMGGRKNVLIISKIATVIIRIIAFFIGYKTLPEIITVAILMSLITIPESATNMSLRSLIADSVDYMEWKTGKRTEGLVSSMQNFTAKITAAIQLFINGLILELLHFDGSIEGIAGQTQAFYDWQWPLFILGPAIGAFLYMIPAFFIKDNKKEREQIESELRSRREAEAVYDN